MRVASKWPLQALGLAAGLALIVVVLGALQYQWSGEVSEAQRQRMQATLRTAMNQFREELHHELAGVCAAFEMDPRGALGTSEPAYAERYEEWRRRTPYPDLVANVFLWELHAPHPRLVRLNQHAGRFEPADCPLRFAGLCRELGLKPSEPPGILGAPPLAFTWRLEGTIPAMVHPLFRARATGGRRAPEPDLAGYVVIELNRACLQKQVFADLVQRYFGGANGLVYQVAVLSSGPSTTAIYLSDPISPNQILAGRDAAIQLFGPRREDWSGGRGERESVAGGAGTDLSQRHLLFFHQRGLVPRFRPPVVVQRPENARWQLVVKHRSGSVEDAAAAGRRRNLALSFGILLVLAMSVAMLVVWTGRAQRLARLQVEFVAGVSHELRTPLAVISSAAENLGAGVVDSKEHVRQYGTLIGAEVRRLSGMVKQILLFASGEAKHASYEIRPVHIADVVDRVLSESLIGEAGLTVEKHIQPGLPPALADAGALTQCLQNLVSNALKYGRGGRWLGVGGQVVDTDRGPEIKVTIEDRGMGIEREDLSHIFEPFYRGRKAREAQIHGTGLGLSLAKRITEAMGGTLSVISAPGSGSIFTIRLPAAL